MFYILKIIYNFNFFISKFIYHLPNIHNSLKVIYFSSDIIFLKHSIIIFKTYKLIAFPNYDFASL
jgi:hypothetical protein